MYTAPELLDLFNSHLTSCCKERKPEGLYQPIEYVLSLGGKRIRPVLMMMSYNLFKDDVESIIDSAIGIEVYHNCTLLHDDLMDNADKRRGKETVHIKWNNNTAILSGDAMLVVANQYMTSCPSNYLKEVITLFNKTTLEICEGQQYDMDFEQRNDVTAEEYIEMIRLKTAVLLACSLKIGAILAGASAEDANKLYHVGINEGLAFQLQDDLLDVYGDTKTFGKNIGGDIVSNKKTYMLIKALEHASESEKIQLENWINKQDFIAAEKIKAVTALYDSIGVKAICKQKIKDYHSASMKLLSEVRVDSCKKEGLIKLLDKMIDRDV